MNISTSLICMNMANVEKDIATILDNAGDDKRFHWMHADFMDLHQVPRLGISPELIRERFLSIRSLDNDKYSRLCILPVYSYQEYIRQV